MRGLSYLVLLFLTINIVSFSQNKSDPFSINSDLGRGINLGNALDAPNEGEWGVVLKEEYFQTIADKGFTNVRVPVRFSNHAQTIFPYAIDEIFFQRVDWVLSMASKYGLYAILDMHHYLEIMSDPSGHKERFLKMWEQIAFRYRNQSDSLLFEILNEPNDKFTAELWNEYLAEAMTIIRGTNPNRTLVIGTAEWGGIAALNKLVIPEGENNTIITFHYYSPFEFTHQGAEWVDGSDAWLGTTWKSTAQQRLDVSQDMDEVMIWAKSQNRPILLGEFGAYSKADMDSRVLWTDYVARQAERREFSFAYWEFCSGFGAYDQDKNEWIAPLLDALIPQNVKIDDNDKHLQPNSPRLNQNYPNPFNPSTRISYELPFAMKVDLNIYTVAGLKVGNLAPDHIQPAGLYTAVFNGGNLSSGTYIFELDTPYGNQARTMLLIK